VAFAPAAESWAVTQLVDRLKTIVQNEHAPMFIIHGGRDYSLGPVNTLGNILFKKVTTRSGDDTCIRNSGALTRMRTPDSQWL